VRETLDRFRCRTAVLCVLTHSTEVVVESVNIVLAEVLAVLHFDEYEVSVASVLDPVRHLRRHVDCRSRLHIYLLTVESHDTFAAHNEPVLGSPIVCLITQPMAGCYDNLLHLMIRRIEEHFIASPRPFVSVERHAISLPDARPVSQARRSAVMASRIETSCGRLWRTPRLRRGGEFGSLRTSRAERRIRNRTVPSPRV